MTNLPNDIGSLKALIQKLLEENAQLKAENAELRRRLGMDSNNSHKPPSSDGYGKKTVKPGLPKEGKRANGGQEGHPGKTLKRVAKPDRIELHLPGQCACCGRRFSVADAHEVIKNRQVLVLSLSKHSICQSRNWR